MDVDRRCAICGGERRYHYPGAPKKICRCGVEYPGMKPGGIAEIASTMVRNRGSRREDPRKLAASQAYWRVWRETHSRGLADFGAEAVFNQSGED